MFHVVLIEPEIPPNTGNIARLCMATGSTLHLVRPLGFSLDDKYLRRAGMDYWEHVTVQLWDSFDDLLLAAGPKAAFYFFTTKTRRPYWECAFAPGDYLVFGRESKGLPESLLARQTDRCLTIPMQPGARSLNLSTAAGVVVYEAVRQQAVKE